MDLILSQLKLLKTFRKMSTQMGLFTSTMFQKQMNINEDANVVSHVESDDGGHWHSENILNE